MTAPIKPSTAARAPGGLTQRQEAFCLAFIETGNASEAYRRAYKPRRMTAKSINEKASQILAGVKVQSRVAALREKAAGKAGYTLERHLERLSKLGEQAEAAGEHLAALKAEELVGKATGHQPVAGRVSVNVGLPASSEPLSETHKWLEGVKGNGHHPA